MVWACNLCDHGFDSSLEMKNHIKKSMIRFSKHWPSGLSISRFVHMCVCLCVCLLLRYPLNVFLPPLPKVGCPRCLEIRNPWGKVMERSVLRFKTFTNKTFTNKGCKIAAQLLFFCCCCKFRLNLSFIIRSILYFLHFFLHFI